MRRSAQATLESKVAFLSDPRSHAAHKGRVEVIETHFAWVFLTARHAYKLKKPQRQSAMDYRTLAARRQGCREELRLNRRLAPSVCLAVVPLSTDRCGALTFGPGVRVEDWLVKMRRLPSARMLDRALATGTVTDVQFDRVVRRLAKFFRSASRHPIDGKSYVRRLRRQIAANRRELQRFGARLQQRLVDQVASAQLECLARSRAALAERGAHVVDGHGDLKPEHVCLGPPLCVIDRLEFDSDLRRLDPFEELAFLALELERMGHRDLATQLLRRSALMCRDNVAGAAIHFYMSHRAATRAMLAAWHLDDPQFPNARHWIARAHSYLRDALRHARRALRLASRDQLQIRGRPAVEQGRKGRAVGDAPHGLPNKRSNRQDREFGLPG